ncbi:MAG: hypothetical protein WKG01_17835, partial [Kofleriaceae bacterium]
AELFVYARTPAALSSTAPAATLPPSQPIADTERLLFLVTSDNRAPVASSLIYVTVTFKIAGYTSFDVFKGGGAAVVEDTDLTFTQPLEVTLALATMTDARGYASVALFDGIRDTSFMIPFEGTPEGRAIRGSIDVVIAHKNEPALRAYGGSRRDAFWFVVKKSRITLERFDITAELDSAVYSSPEGVSDGSGTLRVNRVVLPEDDDQVVIPVSRTGASWTNVGHGTIAPAGSWNVLPPTPWAASWSDPIVPSGSWYTGSYEGTPARFVVSAREDDGTSYVVVDRGDRQDLASLGYTGTTIDTWGSVTMTPDPAEWAKLLDPAVRPDVSLFSEDNPASPYAWEAAFHAPIAIARALTRAGRFEAAQEWLRRIFDPTSAISAATPIDRARACWKFPPFFQPHLPPTDAQLLGQINAWLEAPFRPHAVARMRPTAYMRATVMAYLDNLIAWGDRLFERGTPESVDEAVLVYMRASRILGPRPARIPQRAAPTPHSATTLPRTNATIEQLSGFSVTADDLGAGTQLPVGQSIVSMLLFCMTPNDRLLEYWDTVADRMWKIRNCEDIAGHRRVLPLFEAPIDPALLAAAVAAGLDLDAVLDDLNGEPPIYRFTTLLARAKEMCSKLEGLGSQLLGALEKQDGERLQLVRAAQEASLQDLVREVRQAGVREALNSRETLEVARTSTLRRLNDARMFVARSPVQPGVGSTVELLPVPALALKLQNIDPPDTGLHNLIQPHESIFSSGEASPLVGCFMLEEEARELKLLEDARATQQSAEDADLIGSFLRCIPTTHTHIEPFGIGFDLEIGGRVFGEIASVIAGAFRSKSGQQNQQASRYSRAASLHLRQAEWVQRHNQAVLELAHVDKQLIGARIREELAHAELAVHDRQQSHAEENVRLLRDKFTNEALYAWLGQELYRLYDGAFALVLDLAKRAQRAFRFELGQDTTRFIGADYWQDGQSGLLAAERLQQALTRMDAAYLDENRRELELSKHISLRDRFPDALFALLERGACEIELSEQLFDADYPGQYMRRLRSVSLSLPCVAGPYTNVNCTLALQAHRVRRRPVLGTSYLEVPDADPRFAYANGPVTSIATSTGQNDAGVFEVSFRDDRYMPFEHAGAISRWRLELPAAQNSFDIRTVTDVILHVRYTARDAGGLLARAAATERARSVRRHAGTLALDLRREFPDAWATARTTQTDLRITVNARHFPAIAAANGAVRMFVGAVAPATHERIRVRGDGAMPITCRRGALVITTHADLTPDSEPVTLTLPAEITATAAPIVLVDYAQP